MVASKCKIQKYQNVKQKKTKYAQTLHFKNHKSLLRKIILKLKGFMMFLNGRNTYHKYVQFSKININI